MLLYSQIFAKAEEDDTVTDLDENDLLRGPEGSEDAKADDSDVEQLRKTREQLKEQLQTILDQQGSARWLFEKVQSNVCIHGTYNTDI